MCGIAGLFIKDQSLIENHHEAVERFFDAQLLGVAERGKQASGFAAITRKGKVVMDKAPIHASKFIKEREPLPQDLHYVIGHTRWATKGDIENHMNNHPVLWGSCFVTHNGSIRNDDELFEKYGFDRHAQVDTEILPALLSHSKFETPQRIAALLGEVDGTMAIAAADPILNPGCVLFAKTYQSPFIYHDNKKFFMWASTYDALKDAWGTVFGTPPSKGSFKELGYRKMLVLSDEGFTEYDIPSRYVSKPYMHTPARPNPTTAPSSTASGTTPQKSGHITVDLKEVEKRVKEMRANGRGIARILPLVSRVLVGVSTNYNCDCCENRFMQDDLVVTNQGTLCHDCADVRRQIIIADMDEPPSSPVSPIHPQKLVEFNAWTQDDGFVHNMVIIDLAKEYGLETEGVEFILFRMTDEEAKSIPKMAAFQTALREMYDTDYVLQWEKLEGGGWQGGVSILKKPVVVVPHQSAQLALPQASPKFPERFVKKSDGTTCSCCRKNARFFIARTATKELVGFCKAHWNRCHTAGCSKKPVFVTAGANCYCHDHSRGKSPGLALSVLEKEGFAVGISVKDALVSA